LTISLADKRRKHHSNMDDAAGYLRFLKRLLEDEDDSGELPATYPPKPRWDRERHNGETTSNNNTSNFNEESSATAALINGMPQLTISTNNGTSNTNHFAVFNNEEEEEDDDDVGGDTIVYQTQQQNERARTTNNNNHQSSKNMSTQRILLRIYCSLAEIHSTKAVNCSKSRPAEWILGADEFTSAHIILRSGHLIMDKQHAKLLQVSEAMEFLTNPQEVARLNRIVRERQEAIDFDSQVIDVPFDYFLVSKDKYIHAAEVRIKTLEDKLFEDWNAREEIKNAMGDAWRGRHGGSGEYAEQRKEMEKELDEVLEGMNRTRGMGSSLDQNGDVQYSGIENGR